MSSVSFDPTSFSQRLKDIQSSMAQTDSKKRVTGTLEIVDKENGFVRFLKFIFLPLARFFGADPYSHTRANTVAMELMNQYKNFEKNLSKDDVKTLRAIIVKLNENTQKRYDNVLSTLLRLLPGGNRPLPTPPGALVPPPSVPVTPSGAPTPPPPPPAGLPPPPAAKGTGQNTAAAAVFAQINKGGFKLKKAETTATSEPATQPSDSPSERPADAAAEPATPSPAPGKPPKGSNPMFEAMAKGGQAMLKKVVVPGKGVAPHAQ